MPSREDAEKMVGRWVSVRTSNGNRFNGLLSKIRSPRGGTSLCLCHFSHYIWDYLTPAPSRMKLWLPLESIAEIGEIGESK